MPVLAQFSLSLVVFIIIAKEKRGKHMNERNRRLLSIELELSEMYEHLFGGKYVPGLQSTEASEFNSVIEAFRQRIFYIRQTQEEREKKEKKKNFKQSSEQIRLNQQIRQEIKKAENILGEAVRRMKSDEKGKDKAQYAKTLQNRQNLIKNSFQLLKDVKQVEDGGVYKPPQPMQTLDQIKKLYKHQSHREQEIDYDEQTNLQKFKKKDKEIDGLLDEVINVDAQVKANLLHANEMIDITGEMINKNLNKTEALNLKVQTATKNLAEVLKNYRKPNKLCLDITFVLLLLALIGVVINMLKSSS